MKAKPIWKWLLGREEKKPTLPGPGIRTMLIVGRVTKGPDGAPAVVGRVITIWWN